MKHERTPPAAAPEKTRRSSEENLAAMEKRLELLKSAAADKIECLECGKLCRNTVGLVIHQSKAHGRAVELPSSCPHCERVFASPLGLSTHLARAHQGKKWSRRGASAPEKPRSPCEAQQIAVRPVVSANGTSHEHPVEFPNYCPMCGFALRAVILAMNFKKEGA